MSTPPPSAGIRRRLGAVLFADVAGYSRLMGEDEVGTALAVKGRLKVLHDACARYNGEVLQVRGDGAFLLFSSAIEAVSFALEAQKLMEIENAAGESKQAIRFRIGINLGEILFDDDGVSGDSINIAARIESLAPPGSVCVTGAVYDQIRNKVAVGYEYLGPKSLKNIAEPVDAFVLREDAAAAAMTPAFRRAARLNGSEKVKDLSVVVLPFGFQGDEHESWFATGLTDDITTSLSRFHNLFVISRASAFVFRERVAAPHEAAREFGVRYCVTGVVRKAGGRLRVSIQLTDAIRDRIIWGENYNRQIEDIFDLQDEITQIIVSATAVQIESSERERTRLMPPSDLRAYGFVLQGQQHILQYRRNENRLARQLYDSALQSDPLYARALAAKSRTLNLDWRYDWSDEPDIVLDTALELALKATEIDDTDARGFGELGFVHLYRKEHDAAISAYKRAVLLNPNDADLISDMADALAHSGESDEAIVLLEKAMRLNPFYPDQYLWHLGGAYYNLQRYDEAIRTLQSMQNPTEGRRLLAASYAQLGRLEEARGHAQKVLEAHPKFRVDRWASVQPDRYPAGLAHFIEGLRKAGLP
jgi:TolB-like protein/class 3 adenylate cyclase/Flp pilus assembly protein TadD